MAGHGMIGAALAAAMLAAAAAPPARAAQDFFPRSSFEPIAPAALEELDCWGLWHARNEIFARNDYRFKSARGKAEFGTDGQQDTLHLGAIEEANVAVIQKYEKIAGCT